MGIVIYLIGYIIMLGITTWMIKIQAKEDITVGIFILLLFVSGLSWFGILISLLLLIVQIIINSTDIFNKKIF